MKSIEEQNQAQTASKKARLMQSTPVVVLLALTATFLWGTAYPCMKTGFQLFEIDRISEQMVFAGTRFTGAGLLLLLFCLLTRGTVRVKWRSMPGVVLHGVVMTTLQYIFYYLAMAHLAGAKGAILNSCSAFLGVLFAHFLTKNDRMTVRKAIGCIVGFSGVIVINLGGVEGLFSFSLLGDGAMLMATALFALGGIIGKYVTRTVDSVLASAWQLSIGGVLLLLIGLPSGGLLHSTSPAGWLLLGYMVLLSALAFTLWTLLFQYNPAGKISIYLLAIPIFGVLCSGIFLREPILEVRNLVALLLIGSGIYFVNRPARSPAKNENTNENR